MFELDIIYAFSTFIFFCVFFQVHMKMRRQTLMKALDLTFSKKSFSWKQPLVFLNSLDFIHWPFILMEWFHLNIFLSNLKDYLRTCKTHAVIKSLHEIFWCFFFLNVFLKVIFSEFPLFWALYNTSKTHPVFVWFILITS